MILRVIYAPISYPQTPCHLRLSHSSFHIWQLYLSHQQEVQSQAWVSVEAHESPRCQEWAAWQWCSEYRYVSLGPPCIHASHLNWQPSSSGPQQAGTAFVHFSLGPSMYLNHISFSHAGLSPQFILMGWTRNSLASFPINPHAPILWLFGASQTLFSIQGCFWQNSHCRTLALTEVNGYH